jgi:hypothetical protein
MSNRNKPPIFHQDESGAFVILDDPLSSKNEDELQDDIKILKERLKGCMASELDEE